jgi:hypothetical protein
MRESRRKFGLEVNTGKTKYMFIPRHKNAGQNNNLLIANISFENVARCWHLEMTVTKQNSIHEEIYSRLNSANGCCHYVQKL